MGCNVENFRFRLLKSADFSAVFFMGRAFIAIFKNSACQNGIFAICSLRMLLGHYKRKLQYLQTVQIYHKELPRLSGIIRVHSGRTDIPHNLPKVLPAKAHAGIFPCGCGRSSGAQQAHKKLSPVSMRGNSQNGGQTTKSLLIKPQCSGVPIQQAVSLSSSFPRHCLLFVCAFFPEMPESARSEELPLPPPPAYKTAPASCYGNRGDSFALGALFQALTQNLARGLLVSPAYAGKRFCASSTV